MNKIGILGFLAVVFSTLLVHADVKLCVNDFIYSGWTTYDGVVYFLEFDEINNTWTRVASVDPCNTEDFSPVTIKSQDEKVYILGHGAEFAEFDVSTLALKQSDFDTGNYTGNDSTISCGMVCVPEGDFFNIYCLSNDEDASEMYQLDRRTGVWTKGTAIDLKLMSGKWWDELQGMAFYDDYFYITDGGETVRVFAIDESGDLNEVWRVDVEFSSTSSENRCGAIEVTTRIDANDTWLCLYTGGYTDGETQSYKHDYLVRTEVRIYSDGRPAIDANGDIIDTSNDVRYYISADIDGAMSMAVDKEGDYVYVTSGQHHIKIFDKFYSDGAEPTYTYEVSDSTYLTDIDICDQLPEVPSHICVDWQTDTRTDDRPEHWERALENVSDAIKLVSNLMGGTIEFEDQGDVEYEDIWIAENEANSVAYHGPYDLVDYDFTSLALHGGFDGNEPEEELIVSNANPVKYPTMLKSNGNANLLSWNEDDISLTLTDLTLNGEQQTNHGIVIENNGSHVSLGDCLVQNHSSGIVIGGDDTDVLVTGKSEISYNKCGLWLHDSAQANLFDVMIKDNNVADSNLEGGGIYGEDVAELNLNRCTFLRNAATSGGALWLKGKNEDVDVEIVVCSFGSNEATTGDGGAIYATSCNLIIQGGTSFTQNKACGGKGGALALDGNENWLSDGVTATLMDTDFTGNQAGRDNNVDNIGRGGAIWVYDEVGVDIQRCQFCRNKAIGQGNDSAWGGALAGQKGQDWEKGQEPSVQISSSVFQDNYAQRYGGAILGFESPTKVHHCTFIDNTVGENGLSLDLDGVQGDDILVNNLFYYTNETSLGECETFESYSDTLAILHHYGSSRITDDDDNWVCPIVNDSDPCLVDYHLLPNSPCIDTTTNTSHGQSDTDIDGDERIVGAKADYGADEFSNEVRIQTDKSLYILDTNEPNTIRVSFWGAHWSDSDASADRIIIAETGDPCTPICGPVYINPQSNDSRLDIQDFSDNDPNCYGTVEFDVIIPITPNSNNLPVGDYIVNLLDFSWASRATDEFSVYPSSPEPITWSEIPRMLSNRSVRGTAAIANAPVVEPNSIAVEYQFAIRNGRSITYTDWRQGQSESSRTLDVNDLVAGTAYSFAFRVRYVESPEVVSDWSDWETVLTPPELEVLQAVGTSPNGRVLMRMIAPEGVYDPTADTDSGITYDFSPNDDANEVVGTPYWIDEDASTGTTYTLRWRMPGVDDPNGSDDAWIESSDSNSVSASDVTWGATDDLAPFPSPMRWAADPTVSSDLSTITLTAVTAIDINETIDYNFVCVTDANYTSGWRSLPTYEANSLPINTAFTFTVQARDGAGNVGEASDPVTAWTDNTPPTTNSGDFSLTVSYSNIIAVLDVNEDVNEFWIARVPSTGISTDDDVIKSYGWQEVDEGATYVAWTDYTRAEGGETFWYSYRVRDDANNATAWSTPISATTVIDDRYPSPDPMAWDVNTPIHYEGKTCVIIAAQEAVLPSTLGAPIEYHFNCSDANFTSDWQDSPVGEIRGLQPSTSYSFTVQARRGDYGYEDYVTGLSSSLTVTTQSGAWTQDSIVRDVELDIWYEDLGIAMFEAASGHHLELQPGTHSLTEPITFAYNSGLTLCSTDPEDANVVAATILDASQCAPIVVFQGETWEDPVTSRLEGLTITGADDPNVDGAIQVQGYSSAALSNCVLSYNTTGNGGAIYTYTGSELLLSDCILHDNTADLADGFKGFGGAIYGSTVTLSDCELYENQADRGGGAIYVTDLTMTRCSVHDNESMGHGGAVYSSRPSLANCQIYNNSSEDQGGGLYSYTSASTPATLTNCLFKNNDAVDGGGLRCTGNPGAAVIRGCVFVDNTSSQDGGGISMNGELTLSNCTVVDNTAISTGAGGGIYQGNGDFDLINCLFAGNTPTPYPSGNIYSPDLYSCLIQGATLSGSTAYLNGNPIGQLEGGVLLGSDPLLVDDYHLSSSSPCVDAGLNSVTKPITDIDGELRTVNGTVDIGADEYFEADEIAPSPVAWDIAPVAVDCNTVTMTAVIASDASGPVVYRFDCNDANFSSGWQIDPNYTVDGLTPEATYSFSLQARDAAGNLSSATSDSYVTLPSESASFVATNLTGGGSYETIEAALDDASNGDVIQIQMGTYDVALDLDGLDITLCGTDPNDPNVVAATTLTNSSDGPVLTFPTGSNCQIKGLTIADSNNFTGSGGGVYASYSNLTFHQCRFVNCHSNGDGGGLYGYRCDINLWNCIFMENNATGSGGGAYCYPYNFNDDEVHVVGCVFYQNSATSGGGFCCDGGYVWGLGWCTHSTFVDNTASLDSGAIYGVKYIDSSIFWGNRSPDVGDYHIGGSAPYMTGGLIEGAHESSTVIKASDNSTIGNKNGGVFVFDDPNFTDGYHLSSDSCAIDMGSYSEDLLLMDIDGEPRFVADLDLGADEVYRSGVPMGYRFGSTVESIANNTDDVGQKTTHYVNAYSQYLVMGLDDTYEMVGLRFTDVNIPNGSAIYSAYLEFSCDDPNSEDCSLTIVGQDSDDAVAFSGSRYDVSSRTATTASVSWDVEDWDTSGAIYASVDISSVIEEIVQRPGWSEGNALVLMISGTGQRYAESLEGGYATTLHIVRYLEMQ